MKALVLVLSVFLALLFLPDCNALKLNLISTEDICVYFPNGAIVRKPGSCTETIKCNDGRSSPHTVKCTSGKIVKLDKMTCAADSEKSPDKYCTATCAKSSPEFIAGAISCRNWSKCEKGKLVQSGDCPVGQIFNQDQQRCVYETEECNKTFDICHVAKTNEKIWDKNNCQRHYYCNAKRELKSAKCPISHYYEARTGNCIKKIPDGCDNQHAVPDQACGTKKLALINRFISDQSTCSGYFFCSDRGRSADGNYIPDESPSWGQCKLGEFFDAELEYCRNMNDFKCGEDRCDSRPSGRVLSERPGCQHYLVCQEGYTVDEVKCPDNKYFDPVAGYCVDEPLWYPACD